MTRRSYLIDSGNPTTGAELIVALQLVAAEGTAQLTLLDHAMFFAPQGQAWSPAEHLRHLRKTTAPIGAALRAPRLLLWLRFGRHRARSRSFADLRQAYLATLAAGGRAGRFAPTPEAPPPDLAARRHEIMHSWDAAIAGVLRAVPRWEDPALDRYQLPHPLMGALSMREMLAFTVYHTAHHLNRIVERASGR